MGRKSKLTDAQWDQIQKRLLAGELPADLAREFKIDRAAITRRFSQQLNTVKSVAKQIVSAEEALYDLPVAQQLITISLANDLRAISRHLAGAGVKGAATAHRISAMAHAQTEFLDDTDTTGETNVPILKSINMLTSVANDAAKIGLNLLAANKEMATAAFDDEREKEERANQAMPVDPIEASIAYQKMIGGK